MQLNCLWERETSQTIPSHKTEIKPCKKNMHLIPMNIPIPDSQVIGKMVYNISVTKTMIL